MIWFLVIPLIYSGYFLHCACTAPEADYSLVRVDFHAAGLTMVTVGALAVLA